MPQESRIIERKKDLMIVNAERSMNADSTGKHIGVKSKHFLR